MIDTIPMNDRGSLWEFHYYVEPDSHSFHGKKCFMTWAYTYPHLMRCLAKHTKEGFDG